MTMGAGAGGITGTSIQWVHKPMGIRGMRPQMYKEYNYGSTDTDV